MKAKTLELRDDNKSQEERYQHLQRRWVRNNRATNMDEPARPDDCKYCGAGIEHRRFGLILADRMPPREPTQEMTRLGKESYQTPNAKDQSVEGTIRRIWLAMWDAAKDAS